MSSREIAIVGAGGFGRESADVIEAINRAGESPVWDLVGVYDDAPSEINLIRLANRGIDYLGPVPEEWTGNETNFVVGIGDPKVRMKVAGRLESIGWTSATLIHPSAVVGTGVTVQPGTVICSGVQVSTNISLGRHVHINPNATIGHDSCVDDYVSVNPAATISGDVHIHSRTLIGAHSVVLQGLTVGTASTVGAAACVVKDVQAGETVKGVPAR